MDVAVVDDGDGGNDDDEEEDGVAEEHDDKLSSRRRFIIVMVERARRHYCHTSSLTRTPSAVQQCSLNQLAWNSAVLTSLTVQKLKLHTYMQKNPQVNCSSTGWANALSCTDFSD